MKSRKLILLAAAVFVVIEVSAVVIGLWPIFFYTEGVTKQERAIRIGLAPIPSRSLCKERWEPLLKELNRGRDINTVGVLVPYYAYSYAEIEQGLLHGRIDIAYTTPVIYRDLGKKDNITPLLVIDQEDQDRNRAVLATRKDMDIIKDTRGSRLTFVDKRSFSGYFIPERYLREKIPVPLESWFSNISFAGTHAQAVTDMMRNKTDIVATNWRELDECVRANALPERDIRIIWTSYAIMPRDILCVNRTFVDDATTMKIKEAFLALSSSSLRSKHKLGPLRFSRTDPRSYDAEIDSSLHAATDPLAADALGKNLLK